jgi:chromosome segregation ATPase/DNA-binding transcriptional ArsR family regulator
MYGGTIYAKTRNGFLAVKTRKQHFSPEVRTVFLSVDGKACVAEVVARLGLSASRVERALRTLEAEGYVKISRQGEEERATPSAAAEVDLDFTTIGSTVTQEAPAPVARATPAAPLVRDAVDATAAQPADSAAERAAPAKARRRNADSQWVDAMASLPDADILEQSVGSQFESRLLADAQARIDRLETELRGARTELEDAKVALTEHVQAREGLAQEVAQQQAQLHATREALARQAPADADVQQELAREQSKTRDVQETVERSAETQRQLEQQLEHERDKSREAEEGLKRQTQREAELQQELASAWEEQRAAQEAIAGHVRERIEIEEQLAREREKGGAAHEALDRHAQHERELQDALARTAEELRRAQDAIIQHARESTALEQQLASEQAKARAAQQALEQQVHANAELQRQLAERQLETGAAQETLESRLGELTAAVERAEQSAYDDKLARARVETELETQRQEAQTQLQEFAVHVEELKAALDQQQQSTYRHALAHADLEAQLAAETRMREQAEHRVELDARAHQVTRELLADVNTAAAAQAEKIADGLRKCANYEHRLEELASTFGELREELQRHAQVREVLEAQLTAEKQSRGEVELQLAGERDAHRTTLDSLAELKQSTAAQAEAIANAERRCADFDQQLQTLASAFGDAKDELLRQETLRESLAAEVEGERAERAAAEAHALKVAATQKEASEQFHTSAQQMLVEARSTREAQERALAGARERYERLTTQLSDAVTALTAIEDAAQAHARANAKLEAHLTQHARSDEVGAAPASDKTGSRTQL